MRTGRMTSIGDSHGFEHVYKIGYSLVLCYTIQIDCNLLPYVIFSVEASLRPKVGFISRNQLTNIKI
jgi:hypothetical protein